MKHIAITVLILALVLSGCSFGGGPTTDPGESGGLVSQPEDSTGDAPGSVDEEVPGDDLPAYIDYVWELDAPEHHGMDPTVLSALHTALAETEIYSVLTIKDGYIVDEYYNEAYDESSVFRLASCSKSFTSALVGIAIDEGLISSVDARLSEYFPQLVGTDKEDITIRHLLEHTSGIEWYEWNGGTTFQEWAGSDNQVDFVLEQAVVATPGTVFNYSTGGPHLLAAIMQQATGQTLYDYALEHLFLPLGMRSVAWRADGQGITDGGNGISMTTRDAAKFGQLFLDGGQWNGEQVIPADWVEQSTQQQSSGIGRSGVYGYQWWIRSFGDRGYHTYYAMGHAGQFIFVVPELELVTVITSPMDQDTYLPWPYFSDYILAACA